MPDKIQLIKSLIAEKGITKAKVAERCDLNPSTLSKILSGTIDYVAESTLARIINFLEMINTNDSGIKIPLSEIQRSIKSLGQIDPSLASVDLICNTPNGDVQLHFKHDTLENQWFLTGASNPN